MFAVASSPPLGLNATEDGLSPVANGEPDSGVSAPVAWLTENTDTVLAPFCWSSFAVARSPPLGLNATEDGLSPVANGEPDTGASAPVAWLTKNTDTVPVTLAGV